MPCPSAADRWLPAAEPPESGQLIVAYYAQFGTVWAGKYRNAKQGFDLWKPLQLPTEE